MVDVYLAIISEQWECNKSSVCTAGIRKSLIWWKKNQLRGRKEKNPRASQVQVSQKLDKSLIYLAQVAMESEWACSHLPSTSAVEVIESVLSVCVGFVRPMLCTTSWVYKTMLCTNDLHCATPTCVVHHGAQGESNPIWNLGLWCDVIWRHVWRHYIAWRHQKTSVGRKDSQARSMEGVSTLGRFQIVCISAQ